MVLVMPPVSPYFLRRNLRARHGHRPRRRISTQSRPRKEQDYEKATMWCKDETGHTLYGIGHLEREESAVHPLPEPRRPVHRPANLGRLGAFPAGEPEAWPIRSTEHNRHLRVMGLSELRQPLRPE